MSKKKPRKIPQFKVLFEINGDLCESGGEWQLRRPNANALYKVEDNAPFTDTFEYEGYYSGSGNSRIMFKSVKTGREVTMFMSDFDEVIKAKRFIDNQIVGVFHYCRKNVKQGIRLILDETP